MLFQPYKNVRTRQSAVGRLVNQQMRFMRSISSFSLQIHHRFKPIEISLMSQLKSMKIDVKIIQTISPYIFCHAHPNIFPLVNWHTILNPAVEAHTDHSPPIITNTDVSTSFIHLHFPVMHTPMIINVMCKVIFSKPLMWWNQMVAPEASFISVLSKFT